MLSSGSMVAKKKYNFKVVYFNKQYTQLSISCKPDSVVVHVVCGCVTDMFVMLQQTTKQWEVDQQGARLQVECSVLQEP